jgi:putative YhbY family RNA-binding protein
MAELELDKNQRLALRALAHALHPVVLLGAAGLTEAVFGEIDRALNAHELIKVRVPLDDRDERDALYAAMADRLGAARIQTIGKLVVLFRPKPEEPAEERTPPPERPAKRSSAGTSAPPRRRRR